jgi:enoyl-CoA hydratase/carnithine racemase
VSDYRYLIVSQEHRVLTVTLNRPETLNAWNEAMRVEMRDIMRRIQSDSTIRVLIITGSGRAFSAGEDVNEMRERSQDKVTSRDFRTIARGIHNFLDDIEAIETPVIAAINGVCAGGGLELALSCDFRLVAQGARLGFPEMRVGLIPGSGGCSRLVKAIGLLRAKELVMRGRMVDSATADRYGLVTELVPDAELMTRAKSFAVELCEWSPMSLGMAKVVLQGCANADLETSRTLERLGNSVLGETEEHRESVNAFLGKRKAVFR